MLTQRGLLMGTAVCGAAVLCRTAPATAQFETTLPIPRLIDAKANGGAVTLTAGRGSHAYFPNEIVGSYGLSAPVLGPAIRLKRGETTKIVVENTLDRTTTVRSTVARST